MPAGKFFAYTAELMKLHPPHITDEPIIARMKRIGLEPGKSFDIAKLDSGVAKVLEGDPAVAQQLMAWKVPTLAVSFGFNDGKAMLPEQRRQWT